MNALLNTNTYNTKKCIIITDLRRLTELKRVEFYKNYRTKKLKKMET